MGWTLARAFPRALGWTLARAFASAFAVGAVVAGAFRFRTFVFAWSLAASLRGLRLPLVLGV